MANQITIDIGAAANDGTGDPLRTAFNYVNNNFSNVWNTGLPNSNVQFSDNRILTVNTNANLVLAPNGIAKVVSNVSIVPNMSNVHSIGGTDRRWNTIYAQYLDISNDTTFNNLTVDGNLTVQGNIIQVGNIVTETLTIQLANAASTANAANGSGITVGASDNIATLLYNSTSNVWTTNIGVSVTGNVSGNYILGNGSLLTGLAATYGNANVAAFLAAFGSNAISTTGNISAGNVFTASTITATDGYINTGTFAGDDVTGDAALFVGAPTFTALGTDIMAQFTGNVPTYAQINLQNWGNANTASGDYIITADNGNDSTHFLDMGITSSTWDGSLDNVLEGLVANNGYLYVQDGNLTLGTRAGNVSYTWNFDTNGALTFPNGGNTDGLNFNGTASATVALNAVSPDGNTVSIQAQGNTSNAVIATYANDTATTNTWTFDTNGSTIFPTLSVTRGDRSGTLTGQALVFGDSTQEAIISTPNGTNDINASQRFVINPGAGAAGTTGEGGDIYLYAGRGGDAGGSGGDIKIRGGLAPADGTGGYLDIQGGDTQGNGTGGYVDIRGGESGSAAGGDVNLYGGYGPTDGGVVTITGGQAGSGTGGNVSITGGVGGNGQPTYGNVSIASGASTWTFNNTGNLVLPNDGVIYETNIPFGGLSGKTIALKPYGGTDADQQLLVYPTAGADANHLHLTSGNLYNTELFLGNDNLYVKLANTGDIVVNSNDDTGNTAQWTFGTNGTLTVPGNISATADLSLQVSSGIPSGVSNWQGQGGWNQGFYGNLATTGGTGTGLTVDVAAGGSGYIDINQITINTPGTGYTDGDVITIDNENNLPGTFEVTVSASDWEFGGNGTLTAPGNVTTIGNVTAGNLITSGNISMNWLDVGNIGNIAVIAANALFQITANAASNTAPYWTFNTDGTLYVPGNISGDNGGALIIDGNGLGEGIISLPATAFGGEQIAIVNKFSLGNGIRLETNGGNLLFDNDGVLNVPGNIVMPPGTSLTGSGASPAPRITGFTSVSAETLSATGNITGGNLITSGNLVFSSTQVQSSAYAGGNGHMMMIDTNRTDTYVEIGTADKPFKTFAAAIAAVAAANPTGTVPYTFVLMGCAINEDVDFTAFNFNYITISTTCRSAFNNPVTFGNSALKQLTVRNVEFADTLTITGDGTADQLNDTSFYNVSFNGAVAVTAANSLAFYEAAFFDTVEFVNVNYVYINAAQFNDDWTITVSDSDPVPANGIGPAQVISLDLIANNVYLVDSSASGFIVFQPQNARMGRSAGTYTIPASCIFNPYNSVLIGTWTNNGTATFRNSVSTNAIANVAPTYNGYIGGTAISISGNVTGGNIITAGNVSGNTAGYAIGYRDIPQVSFSGNATIATTDAGKHYYSTESTSYTLTIANNASQGFQVGAAITVVNQGTGNITIAQGSGVTLYMAGNASPGNRSVATFGMATIMKVATDTWFVSGVGVA